MPEPIDRLADLLRATDDTPPPGDAASREALVHALADVPRGRLSPPPFWTAVAVAAVVLGIVFFAWPDQALTYEVAGGVDDAGYVQTSGEPASIAFSDGTSLEIAAGSASRVVSVHAEGAQVLLEHGEMDVRVVPHVGARWSIDAGPYHVEVTGTQFTVAWEPTSRRFQLVLVKGSVVVTGPMIEPGLTLTPGQRVIADVDARDLEINEGPMLPPSATHRVPPSPAPSAASSAVPELSASTTTAPSARSSSAPAGTPSWSALVAAGKYADVMTQARAQGIGAVLGGGDLGQLVALGDAARYTGDGSLSQKVLLTLRKRFPTSTSAKTAAFLLGRMAEGGSARGAIAWFDRYLAESPRGAYAAEALGRKLVLLSKTDPAAARQVASQYLRIYPKGGYASLARQLTQP